MHPCLTLWCTLIHYGPSRPWIFNSAVDFNIFFSKSATFQPNSFKNTKYDYYISRNESDCETKLIPHHQVWTYNNLERYIDSNVAQDLFQNYIKKEIYDIILDVSQRNAKISQQIDGCFELYGADIGKLLLIKSPPTTP